MELEDRLAVPAGLRAGGRGRLAAAGAARRGLPRRPAADPPAAAGRTGDRGAGPPTLLLPPEWLRGRGWPSAAATSAVLLVAVLGLAAAGYVLTVLVAPQLGELAGQVGGSLERIRRWLVEGPLDLSQAELVDLLQRVQQELQDRSDALVRRAIGWTALLKLLASALFALVLAFGFLKDGRRIMDFALDRVNGDRRWRLRAAGRRAWDTMAGCLRGVAVIGRFDGALIGVAVTVLVQQLEGNILRVVMGRAVRLHSVVVMVAWQPAASSARRRHGRRPTTPGLDGGRRGPGPRPSGQATAGA